MKLVSTARWSLLICPIVSWVSACGEMGRPDRAAVRDSAGVRIVTSRSPTSPGEVPSIGSVEVSIGAVASGLNRVIGALRLSDGRIVVADGGDAVIRYFSSDGRLLATLGGEGDGPTEFRTLQAIGRLEGDTVWGHDFSHHRISFISPDPAVVRTVPLRPPLGSALAVGVLEDRTIVVGESWSSGRLARSSVQGLSREPVAYVRYASDGVLADTIGLFPGREVLLSVEDGRGVMGAAPMARASVHASGLRWLAIGDQVDHEIRLFSTSGALERVLRWEGDDLSVGADLESAWRRDRLASALPEERPRRERELAETRLPERRPAFGEILATPTGGFWVADYALPGHAPSAWTVFDSAGIWRGSVAAPAGFRPLDVGDRWVLGVSRDELDVERVELRSLEDARAGASP